MSLNQPFKFLMAPKALNCIVYLDLASFLGALPYEFAYSFNGLYANLKPGKPASLPTSSRLTIFFLIAFWAAALVATRRPSAASLSLCCWSSFSGLAAAPYKGEKKDSKRSKGQHATDAEFMPSMLLFPMNTK